MSGRLRLIKLINSARQKEFCGSNGSPPKILNLVIYSGSINFRIVSTVS